MLNGIIKAREAQLKIFMFLQGEEDNSVNKWLSEQPDDIRILDIVFQLIPLREFTTYVLVILYSKFQPRKGGSGKVI